MDQRICFRIELSSGNMILGYLVLFPFLILLLALVHFTIQMMPMPSNIFIGQVILFLGDLLIIFYALDFLTARVTVNLNHIFIRCGLLLHRNIKLKEIKLIYKVSQEEFIPRGNPAFSKNVVAIEYRTNKKIFISLKERDEFISEIKTRMLKGNT